MNDSRMDAPSGSAAEPPMAPLTVAWLKQFASREESRADWLGQPFYRDGFAYATDGHLAVRIPSEPFDHEWTEPRVETVLKAFQPHSGTWWKVFPPRDSPVKEVSCGECDGEGVKECFHCGHSDECPDCDGTGKYTPQASVNIGGCLFSYETIARVWTMADFRICVRDTDKLSAHAFGFAGGAGVIMPIRRELGIHLSPEQEPTKAPQGRGEPLGEPSKSSPSQAPEASA